MKRVILASLLVLVFSGCGAFSGADDVAKPTGFEPPVLAFIGEIPADIDPSSDLTQSRAALGLPTSQDTLDELAGRNAAEPERFEWLFLTDQEMVDYETEVDVIVARAEIIQQWGTADNGFISNANYTTGPLTQEMVVYYAEGSAFGEETPDLFPSVEFRTVPWTREELREAAEGWSRDGLIDPDGVASPIRNAGISSSGGLVLILRYGTEWGTVTPLLGDDVRLVTEVIN